MSGYFEVTDDELTSLNGSVVVVTGCASGIGLATTKLLLSLGARIVAGDVNSPPITHPDLTFQKTDVTSWDSLVSLFDLAHSTHGGRIDHVFVNAGIGGSVNFLEMQTDPATGQLLEPNHRTLDINLRGMMNTSVLAFHYMRQQQQPPTGSVVMAASASSFQRFMVVDYATSKHGVLGFMRGMVPALKTAGLSIRVNAIAPSWTRTGLVPDGAVEEAGRPTQSPDEVARSALILMADETRNGQLIYSEAGRFREIDESVLLKANKEILDDQVDDNVVIQSIRNVIKRLREAQEG